ncbi:UDP-3-O-(3-hydroxymyristoyl)glucosamine N-acyltransferase [Lishizhenia sp.]|uniref:UDP-3-O-(3-hydroxymyristoyl)glucosamine N-acyltransferase n=1 Tax=Lishizhenia sp. TaxID=2497594 RepID=UPI00299E10DC|nr:UDP-3-O-(3-hydroxymyristoyl)glucosamine N-acyltransferase [Lishizhenia sp.]MDX1445671.1 UDP-3-O-(3-hydroxymyristoyl)glucosamine N-acyltransferase [Lishizhenia sp.]
MKFTAEQIAGIIKGDIEGNKDVTVSGLSKIEEGQEGTLSFLANMKYEEHIYTTGASIAIVDRAFTPSKELPSSLTLIKVDDAYSCFAQLLEVYNEMRTKQPKIEQPSFIDENATIGKDVYVGAFAYIADGAEIGDNVKIYPNVYIGENVKIGAGTIINPGAAVYADCVVGENCLIHGGAIIGADGFGFAPDENGEFQKVPQIGNVVLEDNVEVGSNATIDRATLGSTILRRGVKLDNLVHLAHNVEVGRNSAMAAQVGVAGSAKIGENVMIGGQAGISGHIKIADRTKVVAQSGIPGNVKKPDQTLMGTPGIPIDDFKKSFFGFRKLPYILKKLRELEDKISNK